MDHSPLKLLTLSLLAPLALAGCLFQPRLDFEYQVNPSVLAQGAPQPTGDALSSSIDMSSNPQVKIDPSVATGYETLQEDIKQLYGPSPRSLTLGEVVQQSLANDRTVKIQGYSMKVAEYQIPVSKSIYDLLISAGGTVTKTKEQSTREADRLPPEPVVVTTGGTGGETGGGTGGTGGSSFLTQLTQQAPVLESRTRQIDANLSQLLPTGATLQYAYLWTRAKNTPSRGTLNPLYEHTMTLSLTQPLLRGFGPEVTNADIHIAQLDYRTSAADFETTIQDQLQAALDAYWELVYQIHDYDVQVISYLAALDLLRVNQANADAGIMTHIDVLQAKAAVEARRESVITSRQAVRNAEDTLKRLIFLGEAQPSWELEIKPDQTLTWREIEVDAEKVLAEAFAERPELRATESLIRASEYEVVKAKDAIKPALDFVGSAAVMGNNAGTSEAYDDMETMDFNNFSLGVEFSYPLQNRRARYQYRQRVTEKLSAEERHEQTRDTVVFDVRNAVRELKTARQRIDITLERVKSEEANLEGERKRLDAGISTSFEVLEFQEDVASAQQAYVRAVVDYNQAAILLERARGTLLKTYGIAVDTPDLRPIDKPVFFPIGFN